MTVLTHQRLSGIGEMLLAGDTVAANHAIAQVFTDMGTHFARLERAEQARVAARKATLERLAAKKEADELARHRAAVCSSCWLEHAGPCL